MSRLSSLPALALAFALTAGCSSDGDSAEAAPARTTGAPTGAATAYDTYVALGDSYTAAPLVPPTDVSTLCLRSEQNYPALVASAMPGTELTDVSCSGASTRNMTAPQTGRGGSTPPQFDALAPDTDLVTIGLGGNDHGLFAALLGRCTRLATTDPTGAPCESEAAADGTHRLDGILDDIRANVAGVVDGVRRRAPDARVVVVGYPQLVPESGTCEDLPIATGDYAFAREVSEGLSRAVRLGAEEAQAEFVDLWAPSTGPRHLLG